MDRPGPSRRRRGRELLRHLIVAGLQPGDDVGVRGGHVALLARVVLQVEQASSPCVASPVRRPGYSLGLVLLVGGEDGHAVRAARVDPALARLGLATVAGRQDVQLPAAVAHRRQLRPLVAEDRPRAGSSPCPSAAAAGPCRRSSRSRRRRDAGGGQRRGEQVHRHGRLVAHVPGGDPARPAGDARHAVAAFPGRALHAAQAAGAAAVPRAVVAGEDDQRVARPAPAPSASPAPGRRSQSSSASTSPYRPAPLFL